MSELHRLTICEAAALLRKGEVPPRELDASLRAAIARWNPEYNAFTWLSDPEVETPAGSHDPLLSPSPVGGTADEAFWTGDHPVDGTASGGGPDWRSPLWGLGFALKSNIVTRGQPSDCGSRILQGWRPPYTATAAERLRTAGGHCLGKTNMDEFAMGSSTEHTFWGASRNPWDPARTCGGSSGGAAAAVAADLAFYALGSDTGGSLRQPAHCCGVVGLKPTYGRVSRYGLVAFASSLDQIGPLTKTVSDAAVVYAAIAGNDRCDSTSLPAPVGDPVAALGKPVAGWTVGVPWSFLEEGLAPGVEAEFQACLRELEGLNVRVREIELPALPQAVASYYVICTAEASANLARYDGVRYGQRESAENWVEMIARTRTRGLGSETKLRILLGTFVLSAGYYEDYYRRAQQVRGLLCEDFRRVFSQCDAVAMPTAPTAAFPLGQKLADPLQMYLSDIFTVPASLAGLPAISLPTGLDSDSLPLSLQLMAPPLQEERLLALAHALEQARGFLARKEAAWRTRPR